MPDTFATEQTGRAGSPPAAGQWRIELDGVGKSFAVGRRNRQTLRVLGDISMSFEGGQVTGLIGPSGCGKSTLMLLAAGLESPTDGRVLLDGQEIRGTYDGLGVAFQRDLLMPGRTALANVMLPLELRNAATRESKDVARQLLDIVGLGGFESYYPSEMSGGMKQRVALCRSLVGQPAVLMLDEPFAAVDAFTREDLAVQLETLMAATRKATTLLITHSIDEAVFMCDHVYALSAKPARVGGHVTIDLPRPRTAELRRDPRFHEYTDELRRLIDHGRGDAAGGAMTLGENR